MSLDPMKITDFKGEIPAIPSKKIAHNVAFSAINCDLSDGVLSPLADVDEIQVIAKPGDIRSICKIGDNWVGWLADVDIVKAEGVDTDDQIIYTGDSYPKSTDATKAIVGVPSSYPTTALGLGVPAPTAALTVATSKIDVAEEYGEVHSTVSYCYTYISVIDSGYYEESAPSPPSVPVAVNENMKIDLSEFVQPEAGRNNVMYFRVYRSVAGVTNSIIYQLVPIGRDGSGQFLYNMLATDETFTDLDVESVPQKIYQNLSGKIKTEGWDNLPDTAKGLCQYQNGILAAIYDQQILLSEPGFSYAFPRGVNDSTKDYSYNSAYVPIAIASFRGMLIVGTTANPFTLEGGEPAYQTKRILPYNQACVGKMCVTELGVFYPGKSGLVLCDGLIAKPVSLNTWTKKQWEALSPETLKMYYHDDVLLGFFEGTANGFIYNFKDSQDIVNIDLGEKIFYDGHIVPEENTLNLLLKEDDLYYIFEWASASTNMEYTWQGYHHGSDNTLHSYVRIDGDFDSNTVTLTINADGTDLDDIVIPDDEPLRLPSGYRARDYYFKFVGSVDVAHIYLGKSVGELYG